MSKKLVVLAVSVALGSMLVGCKDKKTTACAHVLVEVAESEVNIQRAREDKDSALKDIAKIMTKEAKLLKEEKVDDEKLAKVKDEYAENLEEYAETYKDKAASIDEWLKKIGKLNTKRYDLTEKIVDYCKIEKKE